MDQFAGGRSRDGTIATDWNKVVRQASDVAALFAPLVADLDREHFWVLLLNGQNKVVGVNLVAIGTLNAALCHPREMFKAAIVGNAAALIAIHNHPSGDPTPSAEDTALTRRLREAGKLIGIPILDHVVMGDGGSYRSMAQDGVAGDGR